MFSCSAAQLFIDVSSEFIGLIDPILADSLYDQLKEAVLKRRASSYEACHSTAPGVRRLRGPATDADHSSVFGFADFTSVIMFLRKPVSSEIF